MAAEDLLQATLTRTYLAWRRLDGIESLDAYTCRALLNTATIWWTAATSSTPTSGDRSLTVYSVLDPSAAGPVMHCAADVGLAWESDIAIIAYDKRTGQVVRCVVGSTTVVPLGRFDSEWSLVPRYRI